MEWIKTTDKLPPLETGASFASVNVLFRIAGKEDSIYGYTLTYQGKTAWFDYANDEYIKEHVLDWQPV